MLEIASPLCDLYAATNVGSVYPTWNCQDSTEVTDSCLWTGVTCGANSNLISLQLRGPTGSSRSNSNLLRGTLPSSLGILLGYVSLLDLSNNRLTGTIPDVFYEANGLISVDLRNNLLNGSLPSSLGYATTLRYAALSNNHLVGMIPPSYNSLTQLFELRLNENKLFGTIPAFIYSFRNLKVLNLSSNAFGGSISSSITHLKHLEILDFSENLIEGIIPTVIAGLLSMKVLKLSNNKITGAIPSQILNIPNLHQLDLSHNKILGTIPATIRHSPFFTTLSLSYNSLTGVIPASIRNLSLSYLSLRKNYLKGSIYDLAQLNNLVTLDINYNQFSGNLPSFQAYNLTSLDISNNKLTTSNFFGCFSGLNNLKSIIANTNNMFGFLNFAAIHGATNLSYIDVSHNMFSNTIPNSIGVFSQLYHLDISSNKLVGKVPQQIGNLNQLNYLNIAFNDLSGTLPTSLCGLHKLSQLDLYNNNSGYLCYPLCFSSLATFVSDVSVCANVSSSRIDSGTSSATHGSSTTLTVILAIVIPIAVILIFILLLFLYLRLKKSQKVKAIYPYAQGLSRSLLSVRLLEPDVIERRAKYETHLLTSAIASIKVSSIQKGFSIEFLSIYLLTE